MRFQRFGDRYQLRLESGDELLSTLTAFAERERIEYAAVSGLGAVQSISLAYFVRNTKQYETHELDEQFELLGATGNIVLRDGTPFPHIHASVGRRDLTVLGGHVMRAVAWPTIELWVSREHQPVNRLPDDESGLALMDLHDRL
ncbi:MAG TPA: PPC domain-containing DNA-binding protein [Candidatus Limnocylindrales bacterium]|nr:PPC domain-containing DNA-binding protein [Candidatus Limnocylindrales bacterium]